MAGGIAEVMFQGRPGELRPGRRGYLRERAPAAARAPPPATASPRSGAARSASRNRPPASGATPAPTPNSSPESGNSVRKGAGIHATCETVVWLDPQAMPSVVHGCHHPKKTPEFGRRRLSRLSGMSGEDALDLQSGNLQMDAAGIDPHARLGSYGGDSLMATGLLVTLNRRFNVDIPTMELLRSSAGTLADIAQTLYLRLGLHSAETSAPAATISPTRRTTPTSRRLSPRRGETCSNPLATDSVYGPALSLPQDRGGRAVVHGPRPSPPEPGSAGARSARHGTARHGTCRQGRSSAWWEAGTESSCSSPVSAAGQLRAR